MRSSTRRVHDVNFGDRTKVRGAQIQPLGEVSVEQSQAFTVYVTTRIEPAVRVTPLVTIEWGHGGASIAARELRVYRRLRIPVVGSTVRLKGRMVDETGKAPGDGITCHFAAFIAPGSDGETLRNTHWISQRGTLARISDGPEQVITVQGYPAAAGSRWVMLFDTATTPNVGDFPAMAAPAHRAFRLDRFDSQGFRFGVVWAASKTPITFTPDPSVDLRVDVEVLA